MYYAARARSFMSLAAVSRLLVDAARRRGVLPPTNVPLNEHPSVAGTPANLAGHAAYALLGCSYLTQDVLSLRALAVGSLVLTSAFQYFRPQPLWLPLRWNAVFIVINAAWIESIARERWLAHRLTDEEAELRRAVFADVPLIPFRRLLQAGSWTTVQDGERLCTEGEPVTRMFVITAGVASVCKDKCRFAYVGPGQMVGEIAMQQRLLGQQQPASATVTARGEGGLRAFVWDARKLESILQQDKVTSSAFAASVTTNVARKLVDQSRRPGAFAASAIG